MSFHEKEALGQAYDARLMRRLLGYLRPYLHWAGAALDAIVAGAGLQLAQPWLTAFSGKCYDVCHVIRLYFKKYLFNKLLLFLDNMNN